MIAITMSPFSLESSERVNAVTASDQLSQTRSCFTSTLNLSAEPPPCAVSINPDCGRKNRRRLHLLLDAYGYEGDRRAFGPVIVQRAVRQASFIREMAGAGDASAIALLPIAGYLDRNAMYVEAPPDRCWCADVCL
jgi:hypothetical protein